MYFALVISLIGEAMLIAAACAMSTTPTVVDNTAWALGTGKQDSLSQVVSLGDPAKAHVFTSTRELRCLLDSPRLW